MGRRVLMMLLVLWPIAAAAQPANGDQTMLGMRLFNQSCRVCHHFKPAEIDAIVAYIKTIPAPSDAPPPVKAGSSRDAD